MRVGTNESILSLAVSNSPSLRTTIPIHIVQKMGLAEGDRVKWDLDKINNTWIATISKKRKMIIHGS